MKLRLMLSGCLMIGALQASAQDPHFSQYFVSPLTVNPALTGFMDGTMRAAINYRSQWASVNNAFTTMTASVDGITLRSKIPSTDRFGIGIMAMSDKVANGLMTNTYIAVSTAYHKALDREGRYSIGVGLQGSYANRGIDGGKLQMNDALDEYGGFTIPSQDAVAGNNNVTRQYLDASAGLLFKAKFDDKNQLYIGASMYHLAKPKATFMNDVSLSVPMRMGINAGFQSQFSDLIAVSLIGQYTKQESASETLLGAIATIGQTTREFDKPFIVYAGCLYRVSDAVIPYVGVEYFDVRFGFSYDLNTSGLSAATKGQGGAEISLVYQLRIPPNKKIQYLCPGAPAF